MKKIHIALVVFVSFVVIVFINNNIPPSYDIVEKPAVQIDFKKTLDALDENLKACKDKKIPGLVANCQYPIKNQIQILEFKQKSKSFVVGPITYYYAGGQVEVSEHGVAVFNLKMLAENTGSPDMVALHCAGAVSCNYHIWDGKTSYIHSTHDFTAGSVWISPGQAKFFSIVFGPAQGYGNYVDFEYEPSKEYFLRITEPFGSADIPLELSTKSQ
jgi:hypothetical protein